MRPNLGNDDSIYKLIGGLQMKNMRKPFFLFTFFLWLLAGSPAQAYIGLCCTHCGGNMPLNIFGGGDS